MTNIEKLLEEIKKCFPSSKSFVTLMEMYMNDNDYRTKHNLQQERKNFEQLLILLRAFKNHAKLDNGMSMLISPGDHRKEESDIEYEENKPYLDMVDEINVNSIYMGNRLSNKEPNDQFKTIKKQTLKNLFDVGGIFEKYIVKGDGTTKLIEPGKSLKGKGSTIMKMNKELFDLLDGPDKEVIRFLSRRIKIFFGENVNTLIRFFNDEYVEKASIKNVDKNIYTLTLGYYGKSNKYGHFPRFSLFRDAYIELYFQRSKLSKIIALFKKYTKITKKEIKNEGKIDWGNSLNQTSTMFSYLSLTPAFELNANKDITFAFREIDGETWPKRSLRQKHLYFEKHKIDKMDFENFELHHSYPLAYAESPEDFKMIDDWRNMIFISPNGHSRFPKRGNYITIISDICKSYISYSSFVDETELVFKNYDDVAFNDELSVEIIDYNKKLNG